MINIGQIIIWTGFVAVCISFLCYFILSSGKQDPGIRRTARLSFMFFAGFVTVGSCVLMYLILNHDFAYSYVARYSSRDLAIEYLISSFWAGQEGSFLLWVLLGTWLGIFLMFRVPEKMEPQVMLIYNLSNIFLMLLLIKQSPFNMLSPYPSDGNGMNMLLQDPWMVIHPPIVFLGYAAFTIPFAYSLSAIWTRDYNAWIKPALPWALFAFVVLGAGIIIGGYWSYKVLGWGGYWGWDPVENASLLPWLTGIALIHGMLVQRTCKKLQKTNFLLAGFSFILVIYCTFLTRSGVLGDFSVHSFTDLGITGWLVFYMLAFIIIFLWLFITRLKEMHASSEKQQSAWFSRESGFICAIIALCLCTFITGLGTSAPLITRIFEKASKVSTDFYVTTNLPLAIFILFLLSFVPILSWEKNAYPKIFPNLILALTGALVAGIITLANGYTGYGILFLSLCAGATVSINLFLIMKFLPKKITFCSGHIAHFGLGLMFLGIISSSLYDTSQKLILKQGAANKALNSEIKLNNIQIEKHGKGTSVQFLLDIKQQDSNFPAKPDIYIETQESGRTQRFVHPYIRRGLINDLYISPIDFDIGQEKGSKNHIDLKQSEKIQLYDYELTFTGFEVSGMQNGKNISVGAHIEVSYKGERRVTLKPVISMDSRHSPKSRVKLPGTENDYITLTGINASSKTIHLDYEIAQHTAHQKNQSQVPSLLAEISIKPGMTLLWAGTFFMLLGGGIGIVRRMR